MTDIKEMGRTKIWVNTTQVPCAICGDKVEEYINFGKSRTLKGWLYVCSPCWRQIERQVKDAERRITILEKHCGIKRPD